MEPPSYCLILILFLLSCGKRMKLKLVVLRDNKEKESVTKKLDNAIELIKFLVQVAVTYAPLPMPKIPIVICSLRKHHKINHENFLGIDIVTYQGSAILQLKILSFFGLDMVKLNLFCTGAL